MLKKDLVTTEIIVKENKIGILRVENVNYISLTDLARQANPDDSFGVIRNWMSNKNSFDYYSLWEELNNEDFNSVESHKIKIDEAPYNGLLDYIMNKGVIVSNKEAELFY